jgi:hypothetical protein
MTQREKRWDDRALVATALVAVGLFLGGYGLRAWVTREARSAAEWCFWHQVERNGHLYCDLTEFEGGKLIAERR